MNLLISQVAALTGWQIAMLAISALVLIAAHYTDKETATMRARRQAEDGECEADSLETNVSTLR